MPHSLSNPTFTRKSDKIPALAMGIGAHVTTFGVLSLVATAGLGAPLSILFIISGSFLYAGGTLIHVSDHKRHNKGYALNPLGLAGTALLTLGALSFIGTFGVAWPISLALTSAGALLLVVWLLSACRAAKINQRIKETSQSAYPYGREDYTPLSGAPMTAQHNDPSGVRMSIYSAQNQQGQTPTYEYTPEQPIDHSGRLRAEGLGGFVPKIHGWNKELSQWEETNGLLGSSQHPLSQGPALAHPSASSLGHQQGQPLQQPGLFNSSSSVPVDQRANSRETERRHSYQSP